MAELVKAEGGGARASVNPGVGRTATGDVMNACRHRGRAVDRQGGKM